MSSELVQQRKFDLYIQRFNLEKAGKKLYSLYFQDRLIDAYRFAINYLRINGIDGSMMHPDLGELYAELFVNRALSSYAVSWQD